MFTKHRAYVCPVCKSSLGLFDGSVAFIVQCLDEDCKIKWCFKPKEKKPIPLDYPGLKKPKGCHCDNCTK